MTRESEREPNVAAPLRDLIQTHHPGIAQEIEGAIETLRKLQQIAGPSAPELPPGELGSNPSAYEATQAFTAPSHDGQGSAYEATQGFTAPSHGGQGPAYEATQGFTAPSHGGQSSNLNANTLAIQQEAAPLGAREVPTLAAGSSFGRYQIVRLLGQGAMGAVYLAYDTQLHRHVALKTPFLGNSLETIERFYREARTAAQIRSPNVCPVHDVGHLGGVHYLSMAFIDGQSLAAAMTEGRLKDPTEIANILSQIAHGLHKAHEQGIIHRDLKPENIMIDRDGVPIVMDFGLARQVDDDTQVTVAGRVLGTPAYMSPEQVEGDPTRIGPATDIYSLGVVLFNILTGRSPFSGTLAAVLRQIVDVEPPRPSTLKAEIGEGSPLERICLKMMAKSPADRFPSMAEVAAALKESDRCEEGPVVKTSILSRIRFWSIRGSADRRPNGSQPSSSSFNAPTVEGTRQ
jgi:predicted Ser/Thr protein kinase